MTVNFICGIAILLTGIQKQKTHYLALATLNFFAIVYYLLSWGFHTASDIDTSIEMLRYQTFTLLLCIPLYLFTFSKWCNFKYTKALVSAFTVITLPLIIINFKEKYSIRYSSVTELINYQSILGDTLSRIQGQASSLSLSVHVVGFLCLLMLFWFAIRLFIQRKSLVSIALLIFLVLQVLMSFVGTQIERNNLDLFFLAALPISIFSLFCLFLMSFKFKLNSKKISIEEQQKEKIEMAISTLAIETSDANSPDFYNNITLNLQKLFETQYAFIGLYHENESGGYIKTISLACSGEIIPNLTYDLIETPCENVVGKQLCIYKNDVDKLFPNDLLLKSMGIKSYVGVPITNKEHKPLGLIVLLHHEELKTYYSFNALMPVFGKRVGAELTRDEVNKRLKKVAYSDYATNLPNRASLFNKINETFEQCLKNNNNALLILLDLDNFKGLNNAYGYKTADNIIKEISHRLKTYAGEHLYVARVSGDEFVIIINQFEQDSDSLIDVHWQALSSIIKTPMRLNNQDIVVSCSTGNVIFPFQTNDKFSVLRFAESALQQAKASGGNQYKIFDKKIQDELERKQLIINEIKVALESDKQLFMVYQPQTDINGALVSAEALIRWVSPSYGFISPGEFIPIVEQTNRVHELGTWVIESVFRQLKAWKMANLTIPKHISINIASAQLLHENFVKVVFRLVQNYDITPKNIVFELTESGILTDREVAVDTLHILRSRGFLIAMDDFGTGYSSLSYLKDLPIDILKIDKSFIDDISTPSTLRLIQSMFSIAEHLNLAIVAEGTEYKEQVEALAELGCECFQGYYFSKPLQGKEFIEWQFKSS